jgi:hypothetical protein
MLITDDQSMSKFTLVRFVGKNMLIFSGTITCLPLALVMVVEPRPAFKVGKFTRYAMIIILGQCLDTFFTGGAMQFSNHHHRI